jgi:hypothetical protein
MSLAVGICGDTLVTSDLNGVDLLDATTLKPRTRLFDRAPRPNIVPAALGLVIWLLVVILRRRGARITAFLKLN